ncbi:hypothetical protein EV363DRAFT_219991 [Boletus edulis]|nr:hypothetical protein EV363DRAFT_219991 [Boletus edulis]
MPSGFIDSNSWTKKGLMRSASSVVRGIQLIPAFEHGLTNELLPGPSQARRFQDEPTNSDWAYYYVKFVDRDILMRFQGGGVGHRATRDWDEFLFQDAGRAVVDEDTVMGDSAAAALDSDDEASGDEAEEWAGIMQDREGETETADGDDPAGEESEESENEDPDRVIADEGEELDDDILDHEGYDAL